MRLSRLLYAMAIFAVALPAAAAGFPPGTAPVFANPYQETASANCGTSSCSVQFSKIVKQTVVQQVSCFITGLPDVQAMFASLQTSSSTTQITLPVFSYAGTPETVIVLGINTSTNMFFAKGDTPSIGIDATDTLKEMNCTITGYHI